MIFANPTATKIAAALIITTLVTACASHKPIPEDRYYRLPDAAVAQPLPRPALSGMLAVRSYDAAAVFRDRALTYAKAGTPEELRHFHFHHWADEPPTLLQQHLVRYLRTKGVATQVIPDEATADWDYLLKGRITHFERLESGTDAEAVIEVEFTLERYGSSHLGLIKSYRQQRPIVGSDIYPTVEAFADALSAIYQQLAADISSSRL